MSISIPAVQQPQIRHGVLIRILANGVNYYVSNTYGPVTYNSNLYQGLGHFLGMDQIQDDLRVTNNQISLSFSGIPKVAEDGGLGAYNSYVAMILDQKIKGSKVWIYRAFFDLTTNQLLTDSVSLRFAGYISNFSIVDGIDLEARDNTKTVVIICSSVIGIIDRKISGRRTNQTDQRLLYPTDESMDRVAVISNTSFDFGKPYSAPSSGSEIIYNDVGQAG